MPLSLDDLHKPLNDFFLNLFQGGAHSSVIFRFDKLGSAISQQDFVDPSNPTGPLSSNLAVERFSELVNHVPSDAGDQTNIEFGLDTIDTAYQAMLMGPSQPRLTGDAAADGVALSTFSLAKEAAQQAWQNIRLESSSGLPFSFKPALAQPSDWYDVQSDSWTDRNFSVSAPPAAQPQTSLPPRFQLWRQRLSDQDLAKVIRRAAPPTWRDQWLSAPPVEPSPTPQAAASPIIGRAASPPLASGQPLSRSASVRPAGETAAARAGPTSSERSGTSAVRAVGAPTLTASPSLHDRMTHSFAELSIGERLKIQQAVQQAATTQPAVTESVSIAFSYCLVKISRPWLAAYFLEDGPWYVPGAAKGSVSTRFNLLPLALLAIKDLVIAANWASKDISAAADAASFGPFKVSGGIVADKLTHPGIQVIGWLLQPLTALPPNDPPPA